MDCDIDKPEIITNISGNVALSLPYNDVKDEPFVFFFDFVKCAQVAPVSKLITGRFDATALFTCPTPQVCVSECPKTNEHGIRDNPICVDNVDTTPFSNIFSIDITDNTAITASSEKVATLFELIRTERCAPYYIESTAVSRKCLPAFVNLPTTTQFENVLFNSSIELQTFAKISNDINLMNLFLNISIRSILDGQVSGGLLTGTKQFLEIIYQDFVIVWPALLVGIFLSLGMSFIYVLLIRCIPGPIIFIGIGLSLSLTAAITIFCYYHFFCFQETALLFSKFDANVNNTLLDFLDTADIQKITNYFCSRTAALRDFINTNLPWVNYQEYTWLAVGIIGTILLISLIILLIALEKNILISIEIIKEASKAVKGIETSILYPLMTFVLLAAVFIYWGFVAVSLYTSSERTYAVIMNGSVARLPNITEYNVGLVTNGTSCDPLVFRTTVFRDNPYTDYQTTVTCQFKEFVISNFLLALQFYNLFCLFWLANFILALGECTLAGAYASWYWAYKKPRDVPKYVLSKSFLRALLFHSGSLAFGALLLAVTQIFRFFLGYAHRKLVGNTGKFAQMLHCMLSACLWCFEKIFQYINRQAYVQIAIYGRDFCTSSCNVVKLLLRNMEITAFKDGIVGFLFLFGRLAVTGVIGIIAYLCFSNNIFGGRDVWEQPLNYYLGPVIFLTVAAFVIASAFMSIYYMAVDTIFICAVEDIERNNGQDRPYYMSKQLMNLLLDGSEENRNTEGLQDGSLQHNISHVDDLEWDDPLEKPVFINNQEKSPHPVSSKKKSKTKKSLQLESMKSTPYDTTTDTPIQYNENKLKTMKRPQYRLQSHVDDLEWDDPLEKPVCINNQEKSPHPVSSKKKSKTKKSLQLESMKSTPYDTTTDTPVQCNENKLKTMKKPQYRLQSVSTADGIEGDGRLEEPFFMNKRLDNPSKSNIKKLQQLKSLESTQKVTTSNDPTEVPICSRYIKEMQYSKELQQESLAHTLSITPVKRLESNDGQKDSVLTRKQLSDLSAVGSKGTELESLESFQGETIPYEQTTKVSIHSLDSEEMQSTDEFQESESFESISEETIPYEQTTEVSVHGRKYNEEKQSTEESQESESLESIPGETIPYEQTTEVSVHGRKCNEEKQSTEEFQRESLDNIKAIMPVQDLKSINDQQERPFFMIKQRNDGKQNSEELQLESLESFQIKPIPCEQTTEGYKSEKNLKTEESQLEGIEHASTSPDVDYS